MTLQTLPADDSPFGEEAGKVSGFSLHAGVAARANERGKLERLARYISRPAVCGKRLSLTHSGLVRYKLKTPDRSLRSASCCAGGTTHVFFEPMDFLARPAGTEVGGDGTRCPGSPGIGAVCARPSIGGFRQRRRRLRRGPGLFDGRDLGHDRRPHLVQPAGGRRAWRSLALRRTTPAQAGRVRLSGCPVRRMTGTSRQRRVGAAAVFRGIRADRLASL